LTSEVEVRRSDPHEPAAGDTTGHPAKDLRFEVEPHHCFACGSLSEHGMQLELHVTGDRCWTELELADRFQGWDGIAHGGIVCTILDEVMAWSLAATDNWGLTARIVVDFKRPVRLRVPIRAEGWIVRRRRRLMDTAARLVDARSGELLATAEAIYVAAGEERKRELMARYRFRLVAEPDKAATDPGTGVGSGGGR
jgi:acyl-coenzyme A thioesterase PaaI-like protein